jgi:hypothetical protein
VHIVNPALAETLLATYATKAIGLLLSNSSIQLSKPPENPLVGAQDRNVADNNAREPVTVLPFCFVRL